MLGMRLRYIKLIKFSFITAASIVLFHPSLAQENYPSKSVKIIVAYTAGGPTDVVARLIAQKLSDKWGQPVVVENKPGASGLIGSEQAVKSTADGYTLLMATAGNLTVNQHLYKQMRFDPIKDFVPIAQTAAVDFVLVKHSSNTDFQNVKDLIAAAKSKPDTITTATSGNGGAPHLAAAMFADAAGVQLTMIPYKGSADAVNAVLSRQTQLDFDAASQVLPHILAGTLTPMAILGAQRSPLLPDVPTMSEAGLPGYNFTNWFGLVGPAGMPKTTVDKLRRDVTDVLQDTEIRARYQAMGLQVPSISPEKFPAMISNEAAKWGNTIKVANITAG